jgi:hypothetical protein
MTPNRATCTITPGCLRGFITEANLDEAELEFPGITKFFAECSRKPATFLDLVHEYVMQDRCAA